MRSDGLRVPPRRRRTRRGRDGRESAHGERYGAAVITALPPPPVIEQPVSYQLSYGVVAGMAAPGTRRVIIRVGSRTLAESCSAASLPAPCLAARSRDERAGGHGQRLRSQEPRDRLACAGASRAATPVVRASYDDAALQRTVQRLAERFGSTSGIYVQNLATGAGAAWNARAMFPGASSLKLAIAVTALAARRGRRRWARPSTASCANVDVLRQRRRQCDRDVLRRLDVRRLVSRQRADAVDRPRRHGDVRRLRARRSRKRRPHDRCCMSQSSRTCLPFSASTSMEEVVTFCLMTSSSPPISSAPVAGVRARYTTSRTRPSRPPNRRAPRHWALEVDLLRAHGIAAGVP